MRIIATVQLSVVLFLCTILPVSQGKEEIFYTLTEDPTTLPTTTRAVVPCDSEYACVNCTTARLCTPMGQGRGGLQEMLQIPCSGSTPWCSGGNCVSEEPEECSGPTPVPDLFTCMRDGLFPDMTDCSRYYRCVDDLPYLQECPETTPYYCPDRQKCFPAGYEGCCATISNPCAGYTGVKQAIEGSLKYFVYCVDETVMTVDRCIGGQTFDPNMSECTPSCPHVGLFPDDEDCTKYYKCSVMSSTPDQTTYNITLGLSCPEGQGFFEEAYECVKKSLVPNCNVPSSALFN